MLFRSRNDFARLIAYASDVGGKDLRTVADSSRVSATKFSFPLFSSSPAGLHQDGRFDGC